MVLANAIRALECGWVVRLNGDGTFGLCRADVDMRGLGFCSTGGANHPACWSYIPHKGEGELMYTITFREMEKVDLLTANVEKKCELSTYFKHLLSQPTVLDFMTSIECLAGRHLIDQAQCDHQAGWRNFSINEFGKPPNICSNHLTGDLFFYSDPDIHLIFFVLAQALPRPTHRKFNILMERIAETCMTTSTSRW